MRIKLKITGSLLVASTVLGATMVVQAAAPPATPAPATPPVKFEDLISDTVVAKGTGFEIKQSQLDQAVVSARATAAARGQDIPLSASPELQVRSLQYLIRVQLLNGVATPEQKAKGQEQSNKSYETMRKRLPDEEALFRQLSLAGLTPEAFKKGMTEEATARLVLAAKVNVSDADVSKFYADNSQKFDRPEMVRVQFLTLGSPDRRTGAPLPDDQKAEKKKLLASIRDRAVKGEDFGKLVRDYSEDAAAKDTSGEISIYKGRPLIPPEFETAAFALHTNQISEIVTTDAGMHIIKMEERTPAGKVALADAKDDIKTYLENIEIQKILPAYEKQLRTQLKVEILDAKLRELEATMPTDVPPPDSSSAAPASKTR